MPCHAMPASLPFLHAATPVIEADDDCRPFQHLDSQRLVRSLTVRSGNGFSFPQRARRGPAPAPTLTDSWGVGGRRANTRALVLAKTPGFRARRPHASRPPYAFPGFSAVSMCQTT